MFKKHYIIPIFVPHKGCPHDCIFCNQKKITGQIEEVTAKDVKAKIEDYLSMMHEGSSQIEVAFYGGSFTAIPLEYQEQLLDAAFMYVKAGRIAGIRVSTRPDCIDERISENLRKYGVRTVELGVQSMDEEVLKLCNRGHSPEDVINSVGILKEFGFSVGVQMMIGLPGDTEEKAVKTAEALIALRPDIARIYPALTIKSTYMEEMFLKGEYQPLTLDEAVELSKKLLILFESNGINVIRIGLQPTENINSGKDIVAGPFHPSMRHLVESLIYRDMLVYLLEKEGEKKEITLVINPKNVSELVGLKKSNIDYIKSKFFIDKIRISQDKSVEAGTLMLNIGEKSIIMSKKDYYSISTK
ncbi:MAG TPA: radical SAM protein [Bacillota bacterium]|nr:radical SAM protein [Bacillota bacterium]HRS20524.1 radical SAM protein [Clostridia bacterium]